MNYIKHILIPFIFILTFSQGISQNSNDMSLGLHTAGFVFLWADKSKKDIYSIEVSPSLGFQVMENHYIYLTGGRSFSNFEDQELFYFGYITRKYLKKYKFLHFYLGHKFSLTNISYERTEEGLVETFNAKIKGFTYGIEAGVHMSIYKNFGIIINTGYNYGYGIGVYKNRQLNLTLQMDIHTKSSKFTLPKSFP